MMSSIQTKLLGAHQSEVSRACAYAASRLSAELPITVQLYQAQNQVGLSDESGGTLFDVGPLPNRMVNSIPHVPYVAAKGGATGRFLKGWVECVDRFVKTEQIEEADQESFLQLGPEMALQQLQIEATRHNFPMTGRPPLGRFVHHLAITPPLRADRKPLMGQLRLPVLGVVYTVTESGDFAFNKNHSHAFRCLPDLASTFGAAFLAIRLDELVSKDCFGRGYDDLAVSGVKDHAVIFALKCTFAHHHFYPYDPVGYWVLNDLSGGDAAAIYHACGWLPPVLRSECADGRTVGELIALLVEDLDTLLRYTRRTAVEAPLTFPIVRQNLAVALKTGFNALLGKLCVRPRSYGHTNDEFRNFHDAFTDSEIAIVCFREGTLKARHKRRDNFRHELHDAVALVGPGSVGDFRAIHAAPSSVVKPNWIGHHTPKDVGPWLKTYSASRLCDQYAHKHSRAESRK